MKKSLIYLSAFVLLSACTTTSPTPAVKHQHPSPNCQRDYPKPAVTADNFGSPEMVEWANHQLECQKRQ